MQKGVCVWVRERDSVIGRRWTVSLRIEEWTEKNIGALLGYAKLVVEEIKSLTKAVSAFRCSIWQREST